MIEASVEKFGSLPDSFAGPAAQSAILAQAAADIFAETDATNEAAFGEPPSSVTTVDGSASADLANVRADGTIVRTYDIMPIVLAQIGDWLWQHSPVRTGRYRASHQLLADGSQIAEVTGADWSLPAQLPAAKQFSFLSALFYAPDIEPHDGKPGESRQAPDGVYQVIAVLAAEAFGDFADIAFAYVGTEPSITIAPLDSEP